VERKTPCFGGGYERLSWESFVGDHRAPFQYRSIKSGRCCLSIRLDTPFRELTSEDTETLAGYWISRWTVVVFSVHPYQSRFKVGTDLGKYHSKAFNGFAIEDAIAVFRDEDQMDVHCEDTVSTAR
jgi:hypothetical protein